MNLLSFAGMGIVMCLLIVTLGQCKPELALTLCLVCGVVLSLYLLSAALPLLEEMRALSELGGIESRFFDIVLKSVGICLAVQAAADVCRDAGQTALAGKMELGGRVALLLTAFPLFREMLSLATQMIGA